MNLEAKRAFVLADWMKSACRCRNEDEFLVLLDDESKRLLITSEKELDQIIARDRSRLNRLDTFVWRLETVSLADCYVYPRMGERTWAVGRVAEIAKKFTAQEPLSSRIWHMKMFASLIARLPLIIVKKESKYEIDDGSHRAIAMFLAGLREANAYVGQSLSND